MSRWRLLCRARTVGEMKDAVPCLVHGVHQEGRDVSLLEEAAISQYSPCH